MRKSRPEAGLAEIFWVDVYFDKPKKSYKVVGYMLEIKGPQPYMKSYEPIGFALGKDSIDEVLKAFGEDMEADKLQHTKPATQGSM